MDKIDFHPLSAPHFPLLLKWLQAPHVKRWWDTDITWTAALIAEKYGPYVNKHPHLHPYIILLNEEPIGYIQTYNVDDFPRTVPLVDLPPDLLAIDLFIGEESVINKGIGSQTLSDFLTKFFPGRIVFVDPDAQNGAAIRAYEKAGFHILQQNKADGTVWMLRMPAGTEMMSWIS